MIPTAQLLDCVKMKINENPLQPRCKNFLVYEYDMNNVNKTCTININVDCGILNKRSKEIIMLLFLAGLLKEIFIANRFIERNFYC